MYQDLIVQAFWLVVILSGVPLAVVALVGTVVAFFQAALQVQEQSIAFLVKISVFILLCVSSTTLVSELVLEYARGAFSLTQVLAR